MSLFLHAAIIDVDSLHRLIEIAVKVNAALL